MKKIILKDNTKLGPYQKVEVGYGNYYGGDYDKIIKKITVSTGWLWWKKCKEVEEINYILNNKVIVPQEQVRYALEEE